MNIEGLSIATNLPYISFHIKGICAYGLLTCVALTKGIFKLWQLNLLEYIPFNLGTLSSATLYTKLTGSNQMELTSTSVSISVLNFSAICSLPHVQYLGYMGKEQFILVA